MKRSAKMLLLVFMLLEVALISVAHAEIYKWTDKYGNTHYSNIPSAEGMQITVEQQSKKSGYEDISENAPIYYDGKNRAQAVVITYPEYNMDMTNNANKVIGKISFGKNCVSPTGIRFDDIRKWRGSPFTQIVGHVSRVKAPFDRFNYYPITVDPKWSEAKVKKHTALLLIPTIIDVNVVACAESASVMHVVQAKNYSSHTYKKARVYLKVHWLLKDSSLANTLYETTTEAYVNNWDGNSEFYDLKEGILLAMEMATNNLLAKSDFTNHMMPGNANAEPVVLPQLIHDDSWSMSNVLNKLSSGYLHAAKLSSALALLTNIKVAISNYYAEHGEMPVSLDLIGIDIPQQVLQDNYINSLRLQHDGIIYADLNSDFGEGAVLSLVPEPVESLWTIHWTCYSNLEKNVLEKMSCKSL